MTLTHAPATSKTAAPSPDYDVESDPIYQVHVWELTDRKRVIYELGFHIGYAARQPEIDQLDHEADRLYMAAFDHRDCTCWRRGPHRLWWG